MAKVNQTGNDDSALQNRHRESVDTKPTVWSQPVQGNFPVGAPVSTNDITARLSESRQEWQYHARQAQNVAKWIIIEDGRGGLYVR